LETVYKNSRAHAISGGIVRFSFGGASPGSCGNFSLRGPGIYIGQRWIQYNA
jgi:hypothetical protein